MATHASIEQYSDDDEEEMGLVQGPPALLGIQFHHAEDHKLVRRLMFTSVGLALLSVILFLANLHHKGHFLHAFFQLVMALTIPGIGYLGIKRESPRLIWLFHLSNVQFALLHAVVGCVMLLNVVEFQATAPEVLCRPYHNSVLMSHKWRPEAMDVAKLTPAQLAADEKASSDIYNVCLKEVAEKEQHMSSKLFWWGITTTPMWGCMIYAALQSHEYYFHLRVRGLTASKGGGGSVTVVESEP